MLHRSGHYLHHFFLIVLEAEIEYIRPEKGCFFVLPAACVMDSSTFTLESSIISFRGIRIFLAEQLTVQIQAMEQGFADIQALYW